MELEKVFWEIIFVTDECVEMYEFLKTYFRMCTNINNYVPAPRGLMIQMKKSNGGLVIDMI